MTSDPKVWAALSILLPQGWWGMPRDWSRTDNSAWNGAGSFNASEYRCGYCSMDVASGVGLQNGVANAWVRICPMCNCPTFFTAQGEQWPGPLVGATVEALPADVEALHGEARRSISTNAHTGAVMLCRKMLMHVAVEKGAEKNKTFQYYVEWLVSENWAPRGAEVWLKYVKDRGNDANHEITPMTRDDSTGLLRFTEALLRSVYELPAAVPPHSSAD